MHPLRAPGAESGAELYEKVFPQSVNLSFTVGECDAFSEPPNRRQIPRIDILSIHRFRHPNLNRLTKVRALCAMGKIKPSRHDADNHHWTIAEPDRLPQDVVSAAESTLPQPMAQDHHLAAAAEFFVSQECPSPSEAVV